MAGTLAGLWLLVAVLALPGLSALLWSLAWLAHALLSTS